MSFFSTQKRDILTSPTTDPLGPGRYDPSNPYPSTKHAAYAPFGSLTSKKGSNSDNGLGPGQYNISSPIIRPSITKYENKNIIIVKVNDEGGHQFKSRTNRFNQKYVNSIGPGSYELSASPPRVRSSSLHPKPKVAEKVRAINRQFCEERKPTLLSDPPLAEGKEREGRARSQSGGKGVVRWQLNRRERFQLLVREPFDQNDKRKALSQFSSVSRKKKIRPSAVFASKSIKSHLETQIYKTNNSFKAELRKMIDYKDQQPGPGSYDPPAQAPAPRVHPRFQFFGSTVERFPIQSEQVVGPGLYEVTSKAEKMPPKEMVSFSEDRHSYLGKNLTPGPGAYQVEHPILQNSFSDKGIEAGFGSVQARFNYKQKETQETVDQGAFAMKSYFKEKQAKRQEEIKLLKRIAQDHPSAVFSSQTKRFEESAPQAVEVGSYDITHNDITAKVARHQKLIQQLEECQLHKPPFLSSDPRFKQSLPQQPNQHRNCWCQVKSVEKQMIDHESPVFLSADQRTTFQQPYKAPPVGYYHPPEQSLIRDSFNSRFRKKQQNTAKKEAARSRQLQRRLQTHPSHPVHLG